MSGILRRTALNFISATRQRCLSTLPSSAEVVVVGGGSIGCNTLYHLAKLGVTDAVLVESHKLTAGTTWHTAGLLWRVRSSDVETMLIDHTRRLNREILPQELDGADVGWIENGGLLLASNDERLKEFKRFVTLGKVLGIESHILSPAEIKDLYPLMDLDGITGALYSPGDGLIDPSSFCGSLAKAARQRGAKVFENTPVTNILTNIDDFGVRKVTGVQTPEGIIQTNAVVICAGVWSRKLGAMANVNVPLYAMRHAYVITDRIEGIQNMPNCRDHDKSIYLRLQGDALAVGGYEYNPEFLDDVSDDFAFSLYNLNWDVFGTHIENAINRVPAVQNTGIKSEVCGPESFTPDHRALIGEVPELRGFFLGCGFNSGGMMLGGGAGQQLARWIVHGRPELYMHGYDIRRFPRQLTGNMKWVKDRSHESYAKVYSIAFPFDEPLAGRNIRKDPFYDALVADGCIFQERLGWERPGWFSKDEKVAPVLEYDYYGAYGHEQHSEHEYDKKLVLDYTFDFPPHHDVIGQECHTCRTKAALFDMSYFGKFFLTGPDSQRAVDWIFTSDIDKSPGSVIYTCMANAQGGVEADLTVTVIDSGSGTACDPKFDGRGFYIAAGGGISQHAWTHIQTAIQDKKFNVNLADMSEDLGMISLQGPLSRKILSEIADDDISDDALPFSQQKLIKIRGHLCCVLRLSFVGELGYELHIPKASCMPIYEALMEIGKPQGLINAGYRAIDALSVEKGYRLWGTDLRSSDTPLEAGLAFTCKLKSDVSFLGREAIEKQKEEGIRKRVAIFLVDEHIPLWGMEAIYRNGEKVGYFRRGEWAFTLNKAVGVGYVAQPDGKKVTLQWIRDGEYEIEVMGRRVRAKGYTKSQFDPENKRLQGIYE